MQLKVERKKFSKNTLKMASTGGDIDMSTIIPMDQYCFDPSSNARKCMIATNFDQSRYLTECKEAISDYKDCKLAWIRIKQGVLNKRYENDPKYVKKEE